MSRPIICPACLTQGQAWRRPVLGSFLILMGIGSLSLGVASGMSEQRVAEVRNEQAIQRAYERSLRGEEVEFPVPVKSDGGAAPLIMHALGIAMLIGGALSFRYRSVCSACDGKAIPLFSPGGQACLARIKTAKPERRPITAGDTSGAISPDAKWG